MTNQPTVNIITIKELASELYINSKSLRKKLRDNAIPKPGTRWEWQEDHEAVLTIRSWKDQPIKTPRKQKAVVEGKEITIEIIEQKIVKVPESDHTLNDKRINGERIFEKSTKSGKWIIKQGEQGVQAIYTSTSNTDATKWITNESEIRPSLPKYIQEEIKKALAI